MVAIISLIISIFLTHFYGLIGCAIGTSVALIIGQGIIMNVYYHKIIKLNIILFWKEIGRQALPMIFVMIIGIAVNYYLDTKQPIIFISSIIVYCLIFTLTIWRFSMNSYEKNIIKSIIVKIYMNKNFSLINNY